MPRKTIPPISELRKICQSCKFARDRRWWRILWRKTSIYITWILLHTGVTADQVSAAAVLLAIVGTILLAFAPPVIALCGGLVYLIYHLLDKVDGEIARYHEKFSIVGVYLDELGHNLSDAGIFVGLGLHLYRQQVQGGIYIVGAAMIGALCMLMIRTHKSIGFLLFAQNILSQPELLPDEEKGRRPSIFARQATHQARQQGDRAPVKGSKKVLSWTRDLVLAISQGMVMFLLVIAGLIVEIFSYNTVFLEVLLKVEVLLQVTVLLALVAINLAGNVRNECVRINGLAEDRFRN